MKKLSEHFSRNLMFRLRDETPETIVEFLKRVKFNARICKDEHQVAAFEETMIDLADHASYEVRAAVAAVKHIPRAAQDKLFKYDAPLDDNITVFLAMARNEYTDGCYLKKLMVWDHDAISEPARRSFMNDPYVY